MDKKVLFRIRGLAPRFADAKNLSVGTRATKIDNMVAKFPIDGASMYLSGDVGYIIDGLESRLGNDLKGLDYSKYFEDMFDNTVKTLIPITKLLIIYNVGVEKAVNTTYSATILNRLIQTTLDRGCSVIVCGAYTYSVFLNKYGIPFVNTLALPRGEEYKIGD